MALIRTTVRIWTRIFALVLVLALAWAALDWLGVALGPVYDIRVARALLAGAGVALLLGALGWLITRRRPALALCLPALPVALWCLPAMLGADPETTPPEVTILASAGWSAAASIPLGSLSAALFTRAALAAREGRPLDHSRLFAEASRDLPWVLWPWSVSHIATMVGLQILLVPGVVAGWLLLMVGPAATLNHRGSSWLLAIRAAARAPLRTSLVLLSFPLLTVVPWLLVVFALGGWGGLTSSLLTPGLPEGPVEAAATGLAALTGALPIIAVAVLYLDLEGQPETRPRGTRAAEEPDAANPYAAPSG